MQVKFGVLFKEMLLIYLQFCKQILGVKRTTQTDFIYGELGRVNYQCRRYFNIIKYWVKLLHTNDTKFNKKYI